MAAADDTRTQIQASPSSTPTGIASAPTVATSAVPAPKSKPRMAPESFNRITERLDAVLVAFVLLFAFLTASFAVHNSDFFQYLAVGRLLAHGDYEFGKDPFTFATENVRWVNHSWLYSYFQYLIYSVGDNGGSLLIVLKALAITVLTGVLLVVSRKPGQRWLIPGACTAVAILALSPRLLLQPVVVSYLFLGLTLLILRWPQIWPSTMKANGGSLRCYWLLPPLFALWVNCDQWFFLGPVTACLYWLGEYTQDALATDRQPTRPVGDLRILGYAVLAGCLACLVNPHHVFALTLPPQLGLTTAASAVSIDKQLQYLFVSPLDKIYWSPNLGLNAAGLAYFPLLIAGVVSFGLTYKMLRYWRVLLFVPFALLSVYHARAIPFFAIVAGPIISLNFLDLVASYHGVELEPDRHRHYWLTGRITALVAAVALAICSVPGWTQAQPFSRRHVGWQVLPDESLARTCGQIAEWRREGVLEPDAHWFNISPDVVNYLAWYCPGERGFFDLRLGLYDSVAADYVDARADLLGLHPQPTSAPDQPPPAPEPEKWPRIFEQRSVNYLIIHNELDKQPIAQSLMRMLFSPTWTVMSVNGHTLVVAWNKDAATHVRNERLKLDMNPQAFGAQALQAPRKKPDRQPLKHEWYMALYETPPVHQAEVDDAALYNLYFHLNWERSQNIQGVLHSFSMLSKAGGGVTGQLLMDSPYSPVRRYFNGYLTRLSLSPAPLYVGLRGLRRGLQVNPDEVQAYLMLARTYMSLFWETPELEIAQRNGFQQLTQIRQTQITYALNKAITLDPDSEEAQTLLVEWYQQCQRFRVPCYYGGEIRFPIDTELRHLQELLRIRKEKFETAKANDDASGAVAATETRLRQFEQEVQRLETDVKRQLDQYEIKSANKPALQRAQTALELGLCDKALEVLRDTPEADMVVTQGQQQVPVGFLMRVNILLTLGEVDEARTYVHEQNKDLFSMSLQPEFRVPAYQWFRLLIASASGDYDDADDALADMSQFSSQDNAFRNLCLEQAFVGRRPGGKPITLNSAETLALMIANMRLNQQAFGGMPWSLCSLVPYIQVASQQPQLAQAISPLLSLEADYPALRGWMALEAGNIAAARQYFRASLIPALPRDRSLSLLAAVGPGFPAAQARLREGPVWTRYDLVPLRSTPLAKQGLYLLETAEPRKH